MVPLSPNNRSCAPDTSAARDFGHRSAAGHVDRTAAHVNQGAIPVSWPSRSTAPRAYKERVPRRLAWEQSWERRLELGANSYGVRFLFGSWESLVDVVAGSSPVGGTRSYCIPNRAGESQFPSVSPPEPTIGLSPRVRGNPAMLLSSRSLSSETRSIPACAGEPASSGIG